MLAVGFRSHGLCSAEVIATAQFNVLYMLPTTVYTPQPATPPYVRGANTQANRSKHQAPSPLSTPTTALATTLLLRRRRRVPCRQRNGQRRQRVLRTRVHGTAPLRRHLVPVRVHPQQHRRRRRRSTCHQQLAFRAHGVDAGAGADLQHHGAGPGAALPAAAPLGAAAGVVHQLRRRQRSSTTPHRAHGSVAGAWPPQDGWVVARVGHHRPRRCTAHGACQPRRRCACDGGGRHVPGDDGWCAGYERRAAARVAVDVLHAAEEAMELRDRHASEQRARLVAGLTGRRCGHRTSPCVG